MIAMTHNNLYIVHDSWFASNIHVIDPFIIVLLLAMLFAGNRYKCVDSINDNFNYAKVNLNVFSDPAILLGG